MNWTTKTCRRLIVKCITYENNVILRSEGVFDNMTVQITLERKRKGFQGRFCITSMLWTAIF